VEAYHGYETIVVEQKNHVGLLTLNRPDKLNTLSAKLFDEIVLGSRTWSVIRRFTSWS